MVITSNHQTDAHYLQEGLVCQKFPQEQKCQYWNADNSDNGDGDDDGFTMYHKWFFMLYVDYRILTKYFMR